MIIVVIGVTGAGKSTVGETLAQRLGWRFIEGDDFHGEANWRKLERGIPLTDADRAPWLARLRDELSRTLAAGESAVLACSALRQTYRDALVPPGTRAGDIRFVQLDVEAKVIESRLAARTGHRASATLLASQLALFESAPDALHVNASQPPQHIVEHIVRDFGLA